VITGEPRNDPHAPLAALVHQPSTGDAPDADAMRDVHMLEREVEYIVDDCFFTVGQVVGMRTTLDYEAVIWWRDHYRAKFLAAMTANGNTWREDRANVTGVAIMLAERAVRYSAGRRSIDREAAQRAAADVERYCKAHESRQARTLKRDTRDDAPARIAGYWCIYNPEP
jgi:hypothetical protein